MSSSFRRALVQACCGHTFRAAFEAIPSKMSSVPLVRERGDHTRSSVIGRRDECSALRVTCQGDSPTLSLVDSKYRLHPNGPSRLDEIALVGGLPLSVPSDPRG